jgi:hypothetical protein
MAIRDSRNAWPFPTIDEASKDGDWTEVSADFAEQMLGAVPPIYIPGGFMLGEEQSYGPRGPIFCAIIRLSGKRHVARMWPLADAKQAYDDACYALRSTANA